MRPPEGGWLVVGRWQGREILWWRNPRHLLPAVWCGVVSAYTFGRGGMGRGWLPEAGGVNDQPAWLLAAFNILAAEDNRMEEARRKER